MKPKRKHRQKNKVYTSKSEEYRKHQWERMAKETERLERMGLKLGNLVNPPPLYSR